MFRIRLQLIAPIVMACVAAPLELWGDASYVRIQDAQGLLRAVSAVQGSAMVSVEVGAEGGACRLQHLDGVSPDLSSNIVDGECRFERVVGGSWKITLVPSGGSRETQIRNVRIIVGAR